MHCDLLLCVMCVCVCVCDFMGCVAEINLSSPEFTSHNKSPFQLYATSKTLNILFTKELQRRLSAQYSRVRVNAAHPVCLCEGVG